MGISTWETFFLIYSPSCPGTYSHSWISDQLPWLHYFFPPASTGLRDVKWFPVLPLEWPVGVVVCVSMCVCIMVLCQRRCHLVTSLLLLDQLPDDPETMRNTEVSKSTWQNVRNCLLLHELQYMPFNGSRYKFDKHHVSDSKKAQRKRRFVREIENRCAIHGILI